MPLCDAILAEHVSAIVADHWLIKCHRANAAEELILARQISMHLGRVIGGFYAFFTHLDSL
jgi:hypothetical protein